MDIGEKSNTLHREIVTTKNFPEVYEELEVLQYHTDLM